MTRLKFGDNLLLTLNAIGMKSSELADILQITRGTVSQWVNHKALPNAERLMQICSVLNVTSDQLLFGLAKDSRHNSYEEVNGIKWVERDLPYLSSSQKEEIQLGIKYFRVLVEQALPTNRCVSKDGPFPNETWPTLYGAFKAAIESGSLQLISVDRDSKIEEELINLYHPKLRNVIVAKVPQSEDGYYIDANVVSAEFVAFLAATDSEALPQVRYKSRSIGLGHGYTMLRFAKNTPSTYRYSIGSKWVPLTAIEDPKLESLGLSANSVATVMATRNPGSQCLQWPYLPVDERPKSNFWSSQLSYYPKLNYEILTELETLSYIFLSVSGGIPTAADSSRLAGERFRTADYEFAYRAAQASYRELGDDQKQFGAEILGSLIHKNGQVVGPRAQDVYHIDLEMLHAATKLGQVWLIAARGYKAQAVFTAIENELVNSVVIDREIAEYLVQMRRLTNGAVLPTQRDIMLQYVKDAQTRVYGTHYAPAPDEIYKWHKGDVVNYYNANRSSVLNGVDVRRIFILVKSAFQDRSTGEFDSLAFSIMQEQQANGIKVYVIWKEELQLVNKGLVDKIADSFILVDNTLFINKEQETITKWLPHMTLSNELVNEHLQLFNYLAETFGISIDEALAENTKPLLIPSNADERSGVLEHVNNSLKGTHYAKTLDELYKWRTLKEAVEYLQLNCTLIERGGEVSRIFILRRGTFLKSNDKLDPLASSIISDHFNCGIKVYIVWEEDVIVSGDEDLLYDFVIIDSKIMQLSPNTGFALAHWVDTDYKIDDIDKIKIYEAKFEKLIRKYGTLF